VNNQPAALSLPHPAENGASAPGSAKRDAARIGGLDALRGLAATGVVAVHAMLILPIGDGIGLWMLYFVLGVPLFFIISAISLSAAYQNTLATRADLKRYAIRRFFRIAPLFYIMLVAWILYYSSLGGSAGRPEAILANILFVFSLIPKLQTSIVPAGWSIGVEMMFYAVFPLLVWRSGIRSALAALVVFGTASWALNTYPYGDMPRYFFWTHPLTNAPYFCLGLVVWRVYVRLQHSKRAALSPVLLGLGVALALGMIQFGPAISRTQTQDLPVPMLLIFGWGAAFSLIVLSQALRPTVVLVNPVTAFMGKISYSLYLSHPLLIYASGITIWAASLAPAPSLVIPFVVSMTLAVAIPLAWLLYVIVEAPFIAIGRRLTARSTGANALQDAPHHTTAAHPLGQTTPPATPND
jgi:peptidoglycan/LPS O-acetylase OafA/YrhL